MTNNPDSFIDEVTDAVRRDRLFAFMRRYGWIGILAIVTVVGISAWTEWTKHREAQRAEAFGDAVMAALQTTDDTARAAALDAVPVDGADQQAVLALLRAAGPDGAPALDSLIADPAVRPVYRDLAEFKRLTAATDLPDAERRTRFEALTSPGAPFRLLADEQIALIDAAAGRKTDAIDRLKRVAEDTEASESLRQRAGQLIVALGGTPGS